MMHKILPLQTCLAVLAIVLIALSCNNSTDTVTAASDSVSRVDSSANAPFSDDENQVKMVEARQRVQQLQTLCTQNMQEEMQDGTRNRDGEPVQVKMLYKCLSNVPDIQVPAEYNIDSSANILVPNFYLDVQMSGPKNRVIKTKLLKEYCDSLLRPEIKSFGTILEDSKFENYDADKDLYHFSLLIGIVSADQDKYVQKLDVAINKAKMINASLWKEN